MMSTDWCFKLQLAEDQSGWWFGCHFLFSHIFGIIILIDFHIFQRGSNHQPAIFFLRKWTMFSHEHSPDVIPCCPKIRPFSQQKIPVSGAEPGKFMTLFPRHTPKITWDSDLGMLPRRLSGRKSYFRKPREAIIWAIFCNRP